MGIKLDRKKPKKFLLRLIYLFQKFLPLSAPAKFKLFLNLEWIFDRLSHEMSFKIFTNETHPIRQYSKTFILDNISESDVVLDLGCNFGFLSYVVAVKAKSVVGIDFSKEVIEAAKKSFQKNNLEFVVGEAREFLDSSKQSFDVLLLSHVLEHIDDPKDFIMKFKNNFKKIYIELPDFDKTYLNQYRLHQKNELIYTDDDHVTEFDRAELTALLKDCGLEISNADFRFGVMKIWCKVQ